MLSMMMMMMMMNGTELTNLIFPILSSQLAAIITAFHLCKCLSKRDSRKKEGADDAHARSSDSTSGNKFKQYVNRVELEEGEIGGSSEILYIRGQLNTKGGQLWTKVM
ncbi:hypothetical protein CRM22_004679 [Opisthorchis felineus]|uniref:Uncharacterized protein n=1 Tax=Opisthorchis felineus TaxID=147828 RepID=A0A4S2M180_OPIFE|nr:hypothetical protein CRM22_004679 [Opisthorchis felineus]